MGGASSKSGTLHGEGIRQGCPWTTRRCAMPEKKTIERAKKDKREGKSASTQAGEFVREEFEHIRAGRHGARSPEQAIAIGLSEARRAGVDLPPPKKGKASAETVKQAKRDLKAGRKNTSSHKSTKRAREQQGAPARRPFGRVKAGDRQTLQEVRTQTHGHRTFGSGEEGCPHQRCKGAFRSSTQGGAHACEEPQRLNGCTPVVAVTVAVPVPA